MGRCSEGTARDSRATALPSPMQWSLRCTTSTKPMKRPPGRDLFLNAATAAMTAVAVLAVAFRLGHSSRPVAAPPRVVVVQDWREYGRVGVRDGPPDAKVVVVEFLDFRCPICKHAATYVDGLAKRFGGSVAVVYRHYPIHPGSFDAAVVATCAGRTQAFKALARALFDRSDSVTVDAGGAMAQVAGITDTLAFRRCVSDPRTAASVARDTLAAHHVGARGTPTFLVNAKRVDGFYGAAVMDSLVDDAMRSESRQR